MLVHTVAVQSAEINERTNSDFVNARAVLERLPEYTAKVAKLRRSMAATEALIIKTERSAAALRTKLDEREGERAARRVADASGYSQVSAR